MCDIIYKVFAHDTSLSKFSPSLWFYPNSYDLSTFRFNLPIDYTYFACMHDYTHYALATFTNNPITFFYLNIVVCVGEVTFQYESL